MIYFIKASQSGAIKIGTSNDPRGRFAALQTGSPEPLELIGVMPGQMDEEKRLHQTFARFRMHGEWFKGAPELLAEIKQLVRGHSPSSIQDLVDNTGSDIWLVRGSAGHQDNGGDVTLFCVCRDRQGRLLPNLDDLVSAAHPGWYFSSIDIVMNVTSIYEHWPEDIEVMREALTSKLSPTWVADFSSCDQMFPALTDKQKQAMSTHPTACLVVGSPVLHPQYGAGKVLAVHGFGEERRARIAFVVGGDKTFILERSSLELTTQMVLDALVAKFAEPPLKSETWRPRWMNPSNS